MSLSSETQMLDYIQRRINILTVEQNKTIYTMIRNTCPGAIRDSDDSDGIFIDLRKIKINTLSTIYNMIKSRVEEIKM